MSGFAFRQRLPGLHTDHVLAQLVGQEPVVTAAEFDGMPLPVRLGRYRVTGVTRVTEPNPSGQYTDILIHMEWIEEQQGTEPSGEERNHAQDHDRPDDPARP